MADKSHWKLYSRKDGRKMAWKVSIRGASKSVRIVITQKQAKEIIEANGLEPRPDEYTPAYTWYDFPEAREN